LGPYGPSLTPMLTLYPVEQTGVDRSQRCPAPVRQPRTVLLCVFVACAVFLRAGERAGESQDGHLVLPHQRVRGCYGEPTRSRRYDVRIRQAEQCSQRVCTVVKEQFLPKGFMPYLPDTNFVMCSYALLSLLKLLKPELRPYHDSEEAIFKLVM
jgi:hypothetical protein